MPQDFCNFPKHHAELRHSVFWIGWNCEAMLSKNNELMAGAGKGTIETQQPHAPDKLTPLTRRPRAHASAPDSSPAQQ